MSIYLSGMIRSEAIHYINRLDISEQEREEMLRDAARLRTIRPQEQRYQWASERDDLHHAYVEKFLSIIRTNGGQVTMAELKRQTNMNGNRLYAVMRRAVAEGDIKRETVRHGKYVYKAGQC